MSILTAMTILPLNAPATCTWSATPSGGHLRTITPATRRTIWTITHITPRGEQTAVLDGTLSRSRAIARAVLRVGPDDVIIATHSVVR